MQRLYYALLFLLPVVLNAQVVINGTDINQLDLDYIEVWDNFNEASKTFNAMIDYGQFDDIEKDRRGDALKILDGKKFMSFNSAIDIINFMYTNGWEMAYVKKISRLEESYIMKKTEMNTVASVPIKFDKESLDSIKDLNTKAKKQREENGDLQPTVNVKKSASGKVGTKKLVKKKVIKKAANEGGEKVKKVAKKKNKSTGSMNIEKGDMEGTHIINQRSDAPNSNVATSTITDKVDMEGTHIINRRSNVAQPNMGTNTTSSTEVNTTASTPKRSIPIGQLLTKPPAHVPTISNAPDYNTSHYASYSSTVQQPVTSYQPTTSTIVDPRYRKQEIKEVEQSLDFLIWKAKKEQEANAPELAEEEDGEEWEEWD